jgi:lysozyme
MRKTPTRFLVPSLLALGGCVEAPPDSGLVAVTAPAEVCASGPTLFGIDVSKWQGTINWEKVKAAGVEYAFIRISDGTEYLDAKFPSNWAGALAQGIPRGSYQFFRQDEDPLVQADIVIDYHEQYGMGELPPVIDIESTDRQSKDTIIRNIRTWIDRIESTLGVRPIIYTGRYFWNDNVGTDEFNDYGLWHPQYTTARCPNIANAWSDWLFWQYSSTGSVDGIAGNVDMNRFNGDKARLLSLVGDPRCRETPDIVACEGAGIQSCNADGRLEVTACPVGALCTTDGGSGPICADERCLAQGGPDAVFCEDDTTVATCRGGEYRTAPCEADAVCLDGRCERRPEPEPEPEIVEPEPEVVEAGPPVIGPAHRLVSGYERVPASGCNGGGTGLLTGLIGCLIALAGVPRRRE